MPPPLNKQNSHFFFVWFPSVTDGIVKISKVSFHFNTCAFVLIFSFFVHKFKEISYLFQCHWRKLFTINTFIFLFISLYFCNFDSQFESKCIFHFLRLFSKYKRYVCYYLTYFVKCNLLFLTVSRVFFFWFLISWNSQTVFQSKNELFPVSSIFVIVIKILFTKRNTPDFENLS